MKDIKPVIAAFISIMLLIPALSVKIDSELQNSKSKYSSSSSQPKNIPQAAAVQSAEVFNILRVSTGKVEEIPADEYICGVVAAEVPASDSPEALKAQAVAAFSYACYCKAYNQANPSSSSAILGADLSDDYRHYDAYISMEEAQVKWGSQFESDWDKISAAVNAVKNKVLTYGGKPIEAQFFSVSTGITESSANVWGDSLPYLVPVASSWDKAAPDYSSKVQVKQADFIKTVQAEYPDTKFDNTPSGWLVIKSRSPSGNVLTAQCGGKNLTGNEIRSLFSLRSADFQVAYKSGVFTFAVVGFGHDVGMSQYGAEYLALKGEKWDEIVKYYYTGVTISDYNWN